MALDYANIAIKLETDGDATRTRLDETEHARLGELEEMKEKRAGVEMTARDSNGNGQD